MDNRRYYGLDALRGTMMMLGIVLHAAMLYIAEPPPHHPFPTDRNSSFAFDAILFFIHSFRMPTFFLLAGFFTALLVEKRGVAGTYGNRAKRILAPLAAGVVTILPLTAMFMVDYMLSIRFGTRALLPDAEAWKVLRGEMVARGIGIDKPTFGHLWFLYFLCFYYLLIPLCGQLVRYSRRFEGGIGRWLTSPFLLLPLALYTATTLWPFRGALLLTDYAAIKPHLPSLVYFATFFVLGYLVHYYLDFLPALARGVTFWALLALVALPLAGLFTRLDIGARGTSTALHLGAVLSNALCTWALVFLFIGSALRFFDRASPWILYVSQSAYWVFLVHLPLVFLAGWLLLPFDLPAAFKFLLVCAFTSLIAFVTFHYWVQRTWISDFLHGRRFDLDWPWRAAEAVRSSALS